jgi:hypothetical protein
MLHCINVNMIIDSKEQINTIVSCCLSFIKADRVAMEFSIEICRSKMTSAPGTKKY